MSIKVALEHRTSYAFERPVAVAPHVVRLRPAPHSRTPIEAYSLEVKPDNHFINWQQDPFGNWLARLVFPEKVSTLEINVGLVADMMVINPFDFFIEEYAEHFPFDYAPELKADLAPYLRAVEDSAQAKAWKSARGRLPKGGVPTVQFLADLNAAVHADIEYSVRMEPGVQTPDETLVRAIGSCRDSAWLLVSILRMYGLAARFVSGYLVQLTADQEALDGPSGPEADFTDLHAWCEVYIPGAGWVGLDPTSALFAGEGHIPLSATPHPSSAAPIEGATEPTEVRFEFSNTVTRIHEDPRVTLPYTEQDWDRINALGDEVDARLSAGDVRLTMGGEPTFVSLDDATSAQWNTDADGPDKRRLANELAGRLAKVYAKGGAIHRGQGKWYPGEPLPRWNIDLQWRVDGVPLWRDPELFADPWADTPAHLAAANPDAPKQAEALAVEIGRILGLPGEQVRGAFEDPLAAIAEEVRQPFGPRPKKGTEKPSVKKLDASIDIPTGWVIPINTAGGVWTSAQWRFRRGRLVLTPGSSAVGLRLPLDSIAWRDPEFPGEPDYLFAGPPIDDAVPQVTIVSPEGAATTALAVEARDGIVHVFLPPTDRLDDYAALLGVIETATARVGTKVVLEGYGPPPDSRKRHLLVTPDPGVIEVNVQPTASWAEQRELTQTLYAEARLARLSTEKFDLDGLHTGTGGGNHITLGSSQPADSPLLRRPDLLASLIRYWQRHPSLSYLFSGRFIGPTSQAPRFDEGRPEAVYEMEIALAELERLAPAPSARRGLDTRRKRRTRPTGADGGTRATGADGGTRPTGADGGTRPTEADRGTRAAEADGDGDFHSPWLVDRALRHMLVDLTGNTHRAEFCIDKLYSPDSPRGRLGLLELRGFEMPPHPQMALLQALLVRSLVAMFWERPNTDPLIRWGAGLHEDFLLPQGCINDIAEVVADLRAAGIDFEASWFEPFTEFRFPRIGFADIASETGAGIRMELRQAIEPWHVLGEEATAGGTARYVDSSVERVQVKVDGVDPNRHLVTCQGVPVPLTSTGIPGQYYAGVRYRAWQPWSALHPSIEVQAPLHFDVVDVADQVSLGGATYHVVHPGGRSYEHPPINANEAEARRAGRFEARGMSIGRLDVAKMRETAARAASPEYPHTLDLRRVPPTR